MLRNASQCFATSLVMKSLVEQLKLDLNYDTCNPNKPTKVLATSKISNKTFEHTIYYTGKVKI